MSGDSRINPVEKFTILSGVAAPLMRINIDTDAIIPSREMKRVSKHGLSEGLFAGWRYTDVSKRIENPNFILNTPPFRNAQILLGGMNFGCGSSREHAVWALKEYGVRCIVAPGFGMIFQSNCVRNGILPVVLPESVVAAVAGQIEADLSNPKLTVDLVSRMVIAPDGHRYGFEIGDGDRNMLIEGLDEIGLTLKRGNEIAAFEDRYRRDWPWVVEGAKA